MLSKIISLTEMFNQIESDKPQGNINIKQIVKPQEMSNRVKEVRDWFYPVSYPRPLKGIR